MSVKFDPDALMGQILAEFWKSLENDKGTRAELRRCRSISEVAITPAFSRMCRQVEKLMPTNFPWESRLAAVLGLISHLDPNEKNTVLAKQDNGKYVELFIEPMTYLSGDRPILSELRFRRLLQREKNDLYPAMIRVLRLLGGNANLFGLAESVFYWGDKIRKRWAFAYFPNVPEKKSA